MNINGREKQISKQCVFRLSGNEVCRGFNPQRLCFRDLGRLVPEPLK